ncbi:hypothetical protein BST36_14140 [Mycolicibacterium moriokaense]|uniref:Uncharacterized protein n=2 Tax=Mycolicibacterium moriokaense TaxID=39691 RepID=A0AAD1HBW2_9MYCO|nr:hypothetical protein [Mycolicibacterium moriokaense]ORB22636.1 hypothetical protein BST36_14140 [Mycolicibacterium moriokaense]BBX02189.1 hypothetical protein MMOR_31250 [Mycolicibacterium moriokaense]
MKMKKIAAGAAFIGMLGFTAVGVSAGLANAEEALPNSPAVTWKLNKPKPHWDDWRGPDHWRGARWDAPPPPPYYYGPGPCPWVPPAVAGWVPPAVC